MKYSLVWWILNSTLLVLFTLFLLVCNPNPTFKDIFSTYLALMTYDLLMSCHRNQIDGASAAMWALHCLVMEKRELSWKAKLSRSDPSWVRPFGGFMGIFNLEETTRQTQNSLGGTSKIPKEGVESIAGERNIQNAPLSLLPPRPQPRWAEENRWMD